MTRGAFLKSKNLKIQNPKSKNTDVKIGEFMTDEKTVEKWLEADQALAVAKAHELELRKQICEVILAGKQKGAKSGFIGKYNLTATGKINVKTDEDLLKTLWSALSPMERKCFKFKLSLKAAEYKTLDAKSEVHRAVTSTPGTPTLKLKGIG